VSLIAGYFSTGDRLATEVLEQRVAEYSILPSDNVEDYDNEVIEAEFGHIISKYRKGYAHRTPTVADGHGNVLMVAGYLFPPMPDGPDTYGRLLESCAESRGRSIEGSEGEFVCAFVDGRSGMLHIINDRFGAVPSFILTLGDRTYFSTNLAFLCFLASGKREPDVLGWLQIFRYRRTLGTRTHMRDVSRLLAASHVTLSREGIRQSQYWHLRQEVEYGLNPEVFADRAFDAFRRGTERRAKMLGSGIIALSGGLDSRLVAASTPRGSGFSAFTFVNSVDTAETPDVRAAAQVCNRLGIEHHVRPVQAQAVSVLAPTMISLTGGLVPIPHTAKAMQCIAAARDIWPCMLNGLPGDILAGGFVPSRMYLDPSRMDQCISMFRRGFKLGGSKEAALFRLFFRREILREHYHQLDKSLVETVNDFEGPTPAHVVTAWFLACALPAFGFVSPASSHPDVVEARPHLGYEYTDLLLQLPAEWLYKKNFYTFMIHRCLPALREVVCANTGKVLSGRMQHYAPGGPEYWPGYWLWRRIRTFAGQALRNRTSALLRGRPFLYSLLNRDEKLLDTTAEIVNARPSLSAILDAGRCTAFLEKFRAGRIQSGHALDDAELVGALATMCSVFEFFDM